MSHFDEIGRSLVGVLGGALVGSTLFYLLHKQGFYGLVLPGALIGLGVHWMTRSRSLTRGILAAVAAVVLGLTLEWFFFPWIVDESLLYFLQNIPKLKPVTLIMIAVGGFFAFWWGSDSRGVPGARANGSS